MRQGVDADAEFADRVGLLEQFAVDAPRAQHQRRGEPSDAAADDDRLHHANPYAKWLMPPAGFYGEDIAPGKWSHHPPSSWPGVTRQSIFFARWIRGSSPRMTEF